MQVLNVGLGYQSVEEFQGRFQCQSEGHWIQSTRCKQVGEHCFLNSVISKVFIPSYCVKWGRGRLCSDKFYSD